MKNSKPAPPVYQQPPIDPGLAAQADAAQKDDIAAMQSKVQGDSASLMARYGALIALVGK